MVLQLYEDSIVKVYSRSLHEMVIIGILNDDISTYLSSLLEWLLHEIQNQIRKYDNDLSARAQEQEFSKCNFCLHSDLLRVSWDRWQLMSEKEN